MALVQQFDQDLSLVLSTLGAGSAILQPSKIDSGRENGFRVTKTKALITMTGKTTAEGPILIGVCANIPLASQLATLLANDAQSKSELNPRAPNWYVRFLAIVGLVPTVFPSSDEGIGKMFEWSYGKNGWSIPEGSNLDFFAFNMDSSALTTGTAFNIAAEHFGVYLRD